MPIVLPNVVQLFDRMSISVPSTPYDLTGCVRAVPVIEQSAVVVVAINPHFSTPRKDALRYLSTYLYWHPAAASTPTHTQAKRFLRIAPKPSGKLVPNTSTTLQFP